MEFNRLMMSDFGVLGIDNAIGSGKFLCQCRSLEIRIKICTIYTFLSGIDWGFG